MTVTSTLDNIVPHGTTSSYDGRCFPYTFQLFDQRPS